MGVLYVLRKHPSRRSPTLRRLVRETDAALFLQDAVWDCDLPCGKRYAVSSDLQARAVAPEGVAALSYDEVILLLLAHEKVVCWD